MSTSPATTAGRRPGLLRSIPFWILLVGSLASAIVGVWLILDKISTMTTTLANGSATGVEVYAGQSWVLVGGTLLAAGLFGFVVILALAVARSLIPAPIVEAIEVIEWTDESTTDDLGLVQEAAVEQPVAEAAVSPEAADAAPTEAGTTEEQSAATPAR